MLLQMISSLLMQVLELDQSMMNQLDVSLEHWQTFETSELLYSDNILKFSFLEEGVIEIGIYYTEFALAHSFHRSSSYWTTQVYGLEYILLMKK